MAPMPNRTTASLTPVKMQFTLIVTCLYFVVLGIDRAKAFVALPRAFVSNRPRRSVMPRAASSVVTGVNDTTAAEDTLTENHLAVPFEEEEEEDNDGFDLPAKTLHGRLLCASQCAYNVSSESPYFQGAGFISGSTTVQLTRGVNSVFIGETVDGIVLAFRGTRTYSPLDWLQNAALFLQRVDKVPGRIHTGFYRAVMSLWEPIKSTLLEMIESTNCTTIFLTGHSKGGAMASICAVLINRDNDLPNATEAITFASAKVGDSAFVKAFNKEVNQTSYEYYLDIVPFLPPSQATMDAMGEDGSAMMEGVLWNETTLPQAKEYVWDYKTCGRRRYIDGNINVLVNVTKELDDQRIRDIEEKTLLSLREFAAAHCLTCPRDDGKCKGGYFAAVAKEVCECCSDW